jgi:hypothetical protein
VTQTARESPAAGARRIGWPPQRFRLILRRWPSQIFQTGNARTAEQISCLNGAPSLRGAARKPFVPIAWSTCRRATVRTRSNIPSSNSQRPPNALGTSAKRLSWSSTWLHAPRRGVISEQFGSVTAVNGAHDSSHAYSRRIPRNGRRMLPVGRDRLKRRGSRKLPRQCTDLARSCSSTRWRFASSRESNSQAQQWEVA